MLALNKKFKKYGYKAFIVCETINIIIIINLKHNTMRNDNSPIPIKPLWPIKMTKCLISLKIIAAEQ